MNAADVLRAARKKIATPDRWIRGRFFSWNGGMCYCADGAVLDVTNTGGLLSAKSGGQTAGFWLSQAARALGHETASRMNDHPTTKHADVLAMFDLAIRLAEASEGSAS